MKIGLGVKQVMGVRDRALMDKITVATNTVTQPEKD